MWDSGCMDCSRASMGAAALVATAMGAILGDQGATERRPQPSMA